MTKQSKAVITEETQGKHYEVDVRNIQPLNRAGGNVRTDYGDEDGSFEELVKSIAINGVTVPIRAFRDKDNEGKWFSIDGHRRIRACNKLLTEGVTLEIDGKDTLIHPENIRVRVITVDARKCSDEQMIIDMVVTNTGKPLTAIELSEAVRRLEALGYKAKEIATKFGMKPKAIRNLSLLASAPLEFRKLLEENKLKYTVALKFIKNCEDFNDMMSKVKIAFGISDKEKGGERPDGEKTSVTGRHLKAALGQTNSSLELKTVFKRLIDNPKPTKDQALFNVLKSIVENKLTSKDIEALLF